MTSNQIEYAKLKESKRHNVKSEKISSYVAREGKRHNKASEAIGFGNIGLGYANLGELFRHNTVVEELQDVQNQNKAKEIGVREGELQLGRDQLEELKRHNIVQEVTGGVDTVGNLVTGALGKGFLGGLVSPGSKKVGDPWAAVRKEIAKQGN